MICGCLATLILLVCTLGCLFRIFEKKDSRRKFQEFYEQEQNFDVLLLGTSHVMNGVSPMDMWEQDGIVAYNLGVPGCRIASSYWILENALQYTTPRMVVLDCAYLLDRKSHDNINYMHRIFDSMPLRKVKIEAILDMYDQEKDIARFLFPFSLYHNRWDELTENDFFYEPVYGTMGLVASCDVTQAVFPDFSATEINEIDNVSTQYLQKIISLCRQREIEVLLTFIPFNFSEQSKNDAAYVRQLADENSIGYLSPEDLIAYVNCDTDYMNNNEDNSHLNLSGAHKISYYLSDYLSENYGIPDHRHNPVYNDWHQYYTQYQSYKLSLLQDQQYLNNYLVGMADNNYAKIIYVNDTLWLQDEMAAALLHNLNMDIAEGLKKETCLLSANSENLFAQSLSVQINEDGYPVLFADGKMLHCWDTLASNGDVFTLVLDKVSSDVLDAASFSLETQERISS